MAVVIETTLGDVTVDLFVEERPRACLNFLKLCKLKYYNFNLFHTIERDFIAQTGDPTGVGDGGESVWGVVEGPDKRFFEAESLPKIKHTVPGLLSLVSVGKFMVGSQFFFTLGSDLTSLDGIHCVIGEVVEGHEILRQLNEAIVDEKFRPYQDIRVTHTVILDDPFSDPRGFQVPSRSPSPSAERLQNGRIGADEDIDDTEGKTMEEIQEMLADREAKARATILEIVGDLPDADIAPPENVLFVCKLNPVTTDDDLEIIFSRFGKVKSCEVIKDKVTGDSLQYAFVEFEEQKSCEAAYFKMDNVLIDDRRIHVDFSQSVSKVKWRGKGRGVVHADERDKKMDFDNLRGHRRANKDEGKYRRSPLGGRRERQNDSRRDDSNRRRRSPERGTRERNGEDRTEARGPRESDRGFRRPSPRDDRRPYEDRHRMDSYDRRVHSSDRARNFDDRRRSPHERYRSPERQRRDQYDGTNFSRRNRDSHENRNIRQDNEKHSNSVRSRSERGDDAKSRYEVEKRRKEVPIPDSRRKHVSKEGNKSKKNGKNKKRKKDVSSSSSSESDSDSDSSTSTASSSSSEEERRKKKKKSKKSQKTKKRPKKKSRRTTSSSSD